MPELCSGSFQSTLPRRERRRSITDRAQVIIISIHAPAKGATDRQIRCCVEYEFQSTLPRRERPLLYVLDPQEVEFQSTLPRRERQTTACLTVSA